MRKAVHTFITGKYDFLKAPTVISDLDPDFHDQARTAGGAPLRSSGDVGAAWSLHPQLQNDTVPVGDLALSRVLAMDHADYPWLVLVPRRPGVTEIIDLGTEEAQLMVEIALASRALKETTGCDKLNVAAIGNVVPQLHVHIVARREDDPLWPKPVWGAAPPRACEAAALGRFVGAIRGRLGLSAIC